MNGNSMIETFDMKTNFKGLIQLLAKSMYSEPDVFIRELIQNAHDSIVRHRDVNPDLAGKIDIQYASDNRTILVRDNGIGMDEHDIKEFLAVIGSTGTGETRKHMEEEGKASAYELIGQFGVGMLSAFVVAEKVVVRTRKLGSDKAFAWHNSGSAECQLFADDLEHFGSEIIITVSPQYNYMLDDSILRKAIKKYCDFISFPIQLNGQGPINCIDAPWHRSHWPSQKDKEAAYRVFINQRYPDTPLDVIPVDIETPYRIKGALYITDQRVPDVSGGGVIDIYVRRMFIRDKDNNVLPQWAKFIRGVIDSPDLKPTAARDNIQRNDEVFKFLQEKLGELVVQRLKFLATNEPNRFKQINHWHFYHLKGMAYFYDEFFKEVGDLLLFSTNKGLMSLREYLPKNAARPEYDGKTPLYYFSYSMGAAQFYRLADGKGWVVIDAGLGFEESLLEKYAHLNERTVHLVRLDATDDKELFQRLEIDEEERYRQFELDMEGVLRHSGVRNILVRMRRFDPPELPAVIILSPETEAELKLDRLVSQPFFMEGFEDVAKEALDRHKHRPIYLSLNAKNPLIRKLSTINRNDPQVQEMMVGIHNSAILYSQNLVSLHNLDILHAQFLQIIGSLLDSREALEKTQQTLEAERRHAMATREKQQAAAAERPDYILLFMITPFDDKYKPLEKALRRIFEAPPYFFQVMLARDYTHHSGLLDNVRIHIRQAHGFLAEISELNSNVMLELGAALLQDDTRPVFSLRSQDAQKDVPADIKEKLFVPYKSITEPPEELEKSIRAFIERDGSIVHEDIHKLLKQRKKRFLSRTLLEQMSIRLEEREITGVLALFKTIEDVLGCDSATLGARTNLVEWKVSALCGQLRDILNHA
ncbi:MAG: ATP-binding protein [Acidobacteria bacterium]|jgi:molecular chaperone HtpG|nr:ATP-binding protein [Acidobacteriota bacterium]